MKKNRFSRSRAVGFFIGGAVTALKSAVAKTSAETIAGVTGGCIFTIGANFSLESLEFAENIADRKKAIGAMVDKLSDFTKDLDGMHLSAEEDKEQLKKINRLIEKRNTLFNSSFYFHFIIDTALQTLLSIATVVSYYQLSMNKDANPRSSANSIRATSTFLFLFAQFITHFVSQQKNTHFAQEVKHLYTDLTNLQNDIHFLEWQYKTLNRYTAIVQHRLDQLVTQNSNLEERQKKCHEETQKIWQTIEDLLKTQAESEKEREDVEDQLRREEARPEMHEIVPLRQKLAQLTRKAHDISMERIILNGKGEDLKKERQNLLQEIVANNAEMSQKQPLKEKLTKRVFELRTKLADQANKDEEERLKIMDTLRQNQP